MVKCCTCPSMSLFQWVGVSIPWLCPISCKSCQPPTVTPLFSSGGLACLNHGLMVAGNFTPLRSCYQCYNPENSFWGHLVTVFANFWDPNLPHFQRKRFSTLEGLGIELGSLESAIYTGRKNRRLNQLGHVCCVYSVSQIKWIWGRIGPNILRPISGWCSQMDFPQALIPRIPSLLKLM